MQVGTIVQITDEKHHWFPCLIIVSEIKSWGVQGYMSIPKDNMGNVGQAYIRLNTNQFEVVGEAKVVVR
jgi:hypothetical protein